MTVPLSRISARSHASITGAYAVMDCLPRLALGGGSGGPAGPSSSRYFLTVRQFSPVSRAISEKVAPDWRSALNRRSSSHRSASSTTRQPPARDHHPNTGETPTHHEQLPGNTPRSLHVHVYPALHVSLYTDTAVPVEGESVADGVVVVAEAAGEGVELGLLVLVLGGLEPVVEAVAVQAGEDFRELGDVAGEGAEVGAGGGGAGEAGLAVVVEAGGGGGGPAGGVAGSGGGGRAAAPGAEGGGEDLVGARGAGVEADGGAGQPGVPGDRGGRVALGEQLPDLLVAFADAAGQGLVRPGPRGGPGGGGGGGLFQAAAVPAGGLLHLLAEVVPQVPAVGDLERAGGAAGGAGGVAAGPVAADHRGRGAGAASQPAGQDVAVAARQQVDDLVRFHVHQDGGVVLALADGDVVDSEDRDLARVRGGQCPDQPEQDVPGDGGAQRGGRPRPGAAGQRERGRLQQGAQGGGPPLVEG